MKLNKRKRGISLIVLVITIIVMIILAAAIILALDSNNITGRANEARSENDKSLIEEEAVVAKAEALLECQQHGIVLDQNKLIEKLGEYFKGSSIEENVVVVDNIWDVVVEDNLEITVAKHGADKILDGNNQTFHMMAPSELSFRSSSNISKFKEVQVNGETVDPSNYTVTEGSTIITLSVDYLKTLPEGLHNVTIVSSTGTPKAKFKVFEPDKSVNNFYYNQPYTAYLELIGDFAGFFIRENGTLNILISGTGAATGGTYTINGNTLTFNTEFAGTLTGSVSLDGTQIYINELATYFNLGNEYFLADEDYVYAYEEYANCYFATPFKDNIITNTPTLGNVNGCSVMFAEQAFSGMDSLTTAIVNVDPLYASFSDCKSLKNVTIGKNVREIVGYAFSGCTSLTNITFEGTMKQWNEIFLQDNWNLDVPATEVKCSDGTVKLK